MFKTAGSVLQKIGKRGEVMKKRSMAAILAAVTMMVLPLSGCGERTDIPDSSAMREDGYPSNCVEGCTCTGGCICNNTAPAESSTVAQTMTGAPEQTEYSEPVPETQSTAALTEEDGLGQAETQTGQPAQDEHPLTTQFSEGELAARREQQQNFAEARQTLYSLPNSLEKTEKINQMDRQILANNAYNFSSKNIVFIGDSITEGITSAIDENGNRVSYVTYANSYLRCNKVLNHGVGGRMFSVYGGEELSLAMNFGNVTNMESDIIVVFAGVNDYLTTPENKRFGDVNDKMSTAGYCGSVRLFMKQLQEYYSDRDIFFVMMYNTSKNAQCTYSDITGQPTLNDYLEVQRTLAREYGFNVIELYNIGFMDCSTKEASDYYLRDGLHPKDNGNIVLGEHIAAELSLYFGQKEAAQQ